MTITIHTLPVGQLETNCYIAIDEKTRQALIIDPGDSAEYITNILSDNSAIPLQILATHGHFDHILAVTALQLAYNIPFFMHHADEFLLKRMRESAKHFLGVDTDPAPMVFEHMPSRIKLGESFFTVIKTPGHTPGSVCFYLEEEKILLSGDTIFADGGVGRTDFSYSTHGELVSSIEKLLQLPDETHIYPGHGKQSTIGGERQLHDRRAVQ